MVEDEEVVKFRGLGGLECKKTGEEEVISKEVVKGE